MSEQATAPTNVRLYAPGRVIHRATTREATVTLCRRPTTGLHTLPTDPWARVGAEASTQGPCLRCMARAL